MRGQILSLVALGVGIGMVGAQMPYGSLLQAVAAFFSVAFLVAAAVVWARSRFRDPYDLNLLREIDEGEEPPDEVHEPDDDDYGSIVCPHCQTLRSRRIPACPNCGRAY